MFSILARGAAILGAFLTASLPLLAAQSPTLTGRVIDGSGRGVIGAAVQAVSADRATRHTVITDRDGRYRFTALPAGQYDLTFSAINFAEVRRRGVTLGDAAPVTVDVTLHLSLSADVIVTARHTFRNLADIERPAENLVGIAAAATEGGVTAQQIEARPIMRAGEVIETVPGVIISQHSGEGKANQYYLRGFNLDHGTDFSTTVAGVPVNLPTHGHGQGYADVNFLIPELVTGVQYRKGPYFAEDGDFSAAGSANINYANVLDAPVVHVSAGGYGWARGFAAASPRIGAGHLLAALELNHNDGPWTLPDNYRKTNGVVRYSRGDNQNGFSLTGLAYRATWNSTDQVPERAISSDFIPRFGHLDATDGGSTARYSAVADYQRTDATTLTRMTGFASRYRLNLFSNFTYFLDDPDAGDQFEQVDRRWIAGGRVTQRRLLRWGGRTGEYAYGLQFRRDRIPTVALHHTTGRVRLDTVREDDVTQASLGVFAQNELHWTPWLRTMAGLRVDNYRVRVDAGDAENSGRESAGLVSPKGGAAFGPWNGTEVYVNAGTGFHSNDARGVTITRDPSTGDAVDPVTPLVRVKGAEAGVRTVAIPGVQTTIALWRLDMASELLFIGDAGTTEASRPSHRRGIEWSTYARLTPWLTADADIAWSRARFTDGDPAGPHVPGAAEVVAALGLTAHDRGGLSGSVRVRYFGPRSLVEDDSVRSEATRLVNVQAGYRVRPNVRVVLDVFNLLNTEASDIDYFYASRLPGEPDEGVEDIHLHPTLPRSVRFGMRIEF